MAEIDWEYVERIKREHDDYLAREARYTGSPFPDRPTMSKEEMENLAKVMKENEKLLKLTKDMLNAILYYHDADGIYPKDYIQDLVRRVEDIADGK